jgi:hypothetical protein
MSIKPGDDGDFTKTSIYADFDPAILLALGAEAQSIAESLAAPHVKTGAFEASFHGSLEHAKNGHPYFRLTNDDPAALSIEFGTAHMGGLHILGKAMDALGDDKTYTDTSKHTARNTVAGEAA